MIAPTTEILFWSYRYCILNEVWRLVADGILNVEDTDNVMSEGLGMRYAFLGPLETAHLNAEGISEGKALLALDHHIHNIFDPPSLLASTLRSGGSKGSHITHAYLTLQLPSHIPYLHTGTVSYLTFYIEQTIIISFYAIWELG